MTEQSTVGELTGVRWSCAPVKLLLSLLSFCEYLQVIYKLRVGRRRNLSEIACFKFFLLWLVAFLLCVLTLETLKVN